MVYECLSEWGQILCAICPNPKLVITGGTSTAICVWETGTSKEKAKSITLKQVKSPMPPPKKNYENAKSESLLSYLTRRKLLFTFRFTFHRLCSGTSGATGSHRRCNVSDCIISVPHRCERLPGSNLHHLGPQQALICYSTQGASGTRLRSVHQ